MKTILLVGANGNIGSYLFQQLNESYEITAVSKSKSLSNHFLELNLLNIRAVTEFVDKYQEFDCLIFLVGLAHKNSNKNNIDDFRELNTTTLINLISALEQANKLPSRIIFTSTISVYGEKLHKKAYSEESDLDPSSPYAITKLEAEEYLKTNFPNSTWILRLAPVYSSDFQLNINRRTSYIGFHYRVGSGFNKLSLCNIENISLCIKGIIQEKIPAGIYNISDNKPYTYNDLLKYLNVKWYLIFPLFFIKGFYILGKIIKYDFLIENSIKLITDNIFLSDKIRQFIQLPKTLDDA